MAAGLLGLAIHGALCALVFGGTAIFIWQPPAVFSLRGDLLHPAVHAIQSLFRAAVDGGAFGCHWICTISNLSSRVDHLLIAARCAAAVSADIGNKRYGGQMESLQMLHGATAMLPPPGIVWAFLVGGCLLNQSRILRLAFPASSSTCRFKVRSVPIIGSSIFTSGWVTTCDMLDFIGYQQDHDLLSRDRMHDLFLGIRPKLASSDVSRTITPPRSFGDALVLVVTWFSLFSNFRPELCNRASKIPNVMAAYGSKRYWSPFEPGKTDECPLCDLWKCPGATRIAELPHSIGNVETRSTASHVVAPPIHDLSPLFPQLEIKRLIGCGGMGAVYQGAPNTPRSGCGPQNSSIKKRQPIPTSWNVSSVKPKLWPS